MEITKETIYQNLRSEMMDLMKRQDTYSLAAYTLTISVWAFALEAKNAWVALLPLFLLIPLSLRVIDFRYSIVFLSAFMGVFLEEKSNEGWEYVRESYYSMQKGFLSNKLNLDNYGIKINELHFKRKNRVLSLMSKFTFTMLSIISIVIFWGLNDFNINITDNYIFNSAIVVVQFLILVLQVYVAVKYRDMTNLKHKLLNDWTVVYKELFDNSEEKTELKKK